jgi:hypothetical protein
MATNDVRDILDVAPSTQPLPAKKAKVAVSKNRKFLCCGMKGGR